MAHYRIYDIDAHGSIESGHDADCDTDDDALDLAHRMTKQRCRIEIWTGTRLVGRLSGERVLLWWPAKPPRLLGGSLNNRCGHR